MESEKTGRLSSENGDRNTNTGVSDEVKTDLKTAHNLPTTQDIELEHGHLAELEVDLDRVLGEEEEGEYEADTSPFPAVRAVVPETDDTDIPVNTFRAWFLGIVSSPCKLTPICANRWKYFC